MSQIIALMDKNASKKSQVFSALSHYTDITMRVGSITIGTMGLLGIPAYFLDKKLETFPLLFIIALVVALPFSQYLVVKKMKEFLKNNPRG